MNFVRPLYCAIAVASCLSCLFSGCRQFEATSKRNMAPPSAATNSETPANLKQHLRNNSASLLFQLLNDEKNLSKLLIVKEEPKELNELVKKISAAAAEGARELERLAKADQSLNLEVQGLPSGEAKTREKVSETKASELLHAKGNEFQFRLLLTQTEALNYGMHLAGVAAENESDPRQARILTGIENSLKNLYEQALNLLRVTRTEAPSH